jgi:tetratricopeptide (TPR) repeat protein
MFERFDEWVRAAEDKLRGSDDYPLVDNSEIDMDAELRRIAHRTVQEDDPEGSSWNDREIERAVAFFELRLIRSGFALAVRFVILNFLYRLANLEGFELEESAPLFHGVVWPHFERFVGLPVFDPGALQDPRVIRWEITSACVTYKWDLVAALFDRMKFLGAITASECGALKGQMYVCSVVASRDQDESGVPQARLTWWWLPRLDRAYVSGDDPGTAIRPFGLMWWGMNLADRVEYSAEEHARLSHAAHEWGMAFQKDSDLLGSYRAAWGKCYFISGDHVKAAEQFEHLLALGLGLPNEAERGTRSQLYQNAAECYEKGGDVEKAVSLLERCAKEFPKTRGLWLKLAGLYISNPLNVDLEKARDCLRKETEVDPSFGEDPRVSIALMFGEIAATDLRATLRKMAESSPGDLQFMTSVVLRHWPSFQLLDDKSRKEWVGAALLLWGSSTPSWNRALLRRKVAGAIADIVEDHLRRLFERFRQEEGNVVLQKMPPRSEKDKDKFQKYLEGKCLSLGDMISEIDATRRLPEPQYPELKAWLQRNARRLSNWDSKPAWRLNELRRLASHGGSDLSEQDAIKVYDLSVWFVNQLYGE